MMNQAIELTEKLLIPVLFLNTIDAYVSHEPSAFKDYERALKVLTTHIYNLLPKDKGKSEAAMRRARKEARIIYKYFVKEKFDTRKCFLLLHSWVAALYENQALYIAPEDQYLDFLLDMREILSQGFDTIENFDKIDNSAMNHLPVVHKMAQDRGYWVDFDIRVS